MLGDDVGARVGTCVGVKLIVGDNVGGRLGTSVGVKLMLGDDVGEKVGGDDGPLGARVGTIEGFTLIKFGRDVGIRVGTIEGFTLIKLGSDVGSRVGVMVDGLSVGSNSGSTICCKVRCNS